MNIIEQHLPEVISERMACNIFNVNRNTFRNKMASYSLCGPSQPIDRSRKSSVQPRALKSEEKTKILTIMNSNEFYNQPPIQIYYELLQRGEYYCSVSTFHRLLRAKEQHGERRQQRPAQSHAIPRLYARSPNEVWTWDITKLATIKRGEYLSLYVVMDLFSRYIVSWMLSRKENSALASQLIEQASTHYGIKSGALTLHQDRGSPMTAHCYLDLLSELAITASHSRPRVSNDNAMSESQFKTLKYQPDYPRRFDSYDHAQRWCQDYVQWYNTQHHHSSLAGFTPEQVFDGSYSAISLKRKTALSDAYERHPERFLKGVPKTAIPPQEVYINPVIETDDITAESGVNFPTLNRAKAI